MVVLTDVSGQTVGTSFKGQAFFSLGLLDPWRWHQYFSQKVSKKLPFYAA